MLDVWNQIGEIFVGSLGVLDFEAASCEVGGALI